MLAPKDPQCQPRPGSFLQQLPFPTEPSKKPKSLMVWDHDIIPVLKSSHVPPAPSQSHFQSWAKALLGLPESTQRWFCSPGTSRGANEGLSADSDHSSENTQLQTNEQMSRKEQGPHTDSVLAVPRFFQLEREPLLSHGPFPCLLWGKHNNSMPWLAQIT